MKEPQPNDILNLPDQYLRNIAVDNVIFGYHNKELRVLLQQPFLGMKWTVTGGFIKKTEKIEEAANRITFLRTGLAGLFLKQFHCFGGPDRVIDSEMNPESLSKFLGKTIPADFWMFDYTVSVAFYTLTEFSKVKIKKSTMEAACEWWPIASLPPLMFDHKHIISEALKSLRLHIAHYPIGYELLPNKFTLPEIHSLYETILGKPLDDRNFTRRMLATGILEKLNETKNIGPHRSPYLYKFNKANYDKGLRTGVDLAF